MCNESSYQFIKPFRFMKEEYRDSYNLAKAFIRNWDIAISVFRRGDLLFFWTEYVEDAGEAGQKATEYFRYAYNCMWESSKKEDVLFQMVLLHIEPTLPHFAFVPGSEAVHWYDDIKNMAYWVEGLYESIEGGKTTPPPERFDSMYYNRCWIDMALEEGLPWVCEILLKS